jgi:HTH-type transcriptional regulator / antitoxin HipB
VRGHDSLVGDWKALGSAIRNARTDRGLTQVDLAEKAGVSRAWLARLEAGHRRAEIDHIFKVLNVLGLAVRLTAKPRNETEAAILTAWENRNG